MDKDDLDTIRRIIEYIFKKHKAIEKNVYSVYRIAHNNDFQCDYYEIIAVKYSYLIGDSLKKILEYYDRDEINLVINKIIEDREIEK